MARLNCKCGELLTNSLSPNNIELVVYTDEEWDDIINQAEKIDPLSIPEPRYEVWRCPKCERIYVFKEGEDGPYKTYILEK